MKIKTRKATTNTYKITKNIADISKILSSLINKKYSPLYTILQSNIQATINGVGLDHF